MAFPSIAELDALDLSPPTSASSPPQLLSPQDLDQIDLTPAPRFTRPPDRVPQISDVTQGGPRVPIGGPSGPIEDELGPGPTRAAVGAVRFAGRSLGQGGKLLEATAGDIASIPSDIAGYTKPFENIKAFSENPEADLPIEQRANQPGAIGRFAMKAGLGVFRMEPQLAASFGLGAIGAPASVAASVPMFVTDKGEFDPVGATIAAGLPGVNKFGEDLVAGALSKIPVSQVLVKELADNSGKLRGTVIQKLGGMTISNDEFRKFLEAGGGFMAANAYLLAAQAPNIAQLPPDARKQAVLDIVAQNIAPSLLGFVRPGVSKMLQGMTDLQRQFNEQFPGGRMPPAQPGQPIPSTEQPKGPNAPPNLPVETSVPVQSQGTPPQRETVESSSARNFVPGSTGSEVQGPISPPVAPVTTPPIPDGGISPPIPAPASPVPSTAAEPIQPAAPGPTANVPSWNGEVEILAPHETGLASPTIPEGQHYLFHTKRGDVAPTKTGNVFVVNHFERMRDARELSAALNGQGVPAKVEAWLKGQKNKPMWAVLVPNVSQVFADTIRGEMAKETSAAPPKPIGRSIRPKGETKAPLPATKVDPDATKPVVPETKAVVVPKSEKIPPNSSFIEVVDYDGNLTARVALPHNGTPEGAVESAKKVQDYANKNFAWKSEFYNTNSRVGATGADGKLKWVISPNMAHVAEAGTKEARYILGDLSAGTEATESPKALPPIPETKAAVGDTEASPIQSKIIDHWRSKVEPVLHDFFAAFNSFSAERLEKNNIKPAGLSASEWLEKVAAQQPVWGKGGRKSGLTGIQMLSQKNLWPTEGPEGEALRSSMLAAVRALKNAPGRNLAWMLAQEKSETQRTGTPTPTQPVSVKDDRQRLREKQDRLIAIAMARGLPTDIPVSETQVGAPTIQDLKAQIYPKFESSIDSALASLETEPTAQPAAAKVERESVGVPSLLEFARSKVSPEIAQKLTNESQVESFRSQWEKERKSAKVEQVKPVETKSEQRTGFDTKQAKSQKKFLLSEIDKAIDGAPEFSEGKWNSPELNAEHDSTLKAFAGEPQRNNYGHTAEDLKRYADERKAWADQVEPQFEPLLQKYNIPKRFPGSVPYRNVLGEDVQNYVPYDIGFSDRMKLLREAISKADAALSDKVVIEVPGDGVFSIRNNKQALAQFKEKAESFPTSAPRQGKPGKGRSSPSNPSPIGSLEVENAVKAAALSAGQDASRPTIQNIFSDGKQTVSTDGRRMNRIDVGLPGASPKGSIYTAQGKKIPKDKELGQYPSWKQVIPDKPKLIFKGLDTERLFTVIKQAQEATTERLSAVNLLRNPDGSLAVTSGSSSEAGTYAHNVKDGAKPVAAVNPEYLIDAINAVRILGNDKVDIHSEMKPVGWETGFTGLGPLVLKANGIDSILMPMKLEGDNTSGLTKFDFMAPDKALAEMKAQLENLAGVPRNAPEVEWLNEEIAKREAAPVEKPPQASLPAKPRPPVPESVLRGPLTAQTVAELRKLVNSPDAGIPRAGVKLINAFLDSPLGDMLEGIRFRIADTLDGGWQGSSMQDLLGGIVEWVRQSDPEVAIHEFLHAGVWPRLPEQLQAEFERLRVETLKELAREARVEGKEERARAFEELLANPTLGGEDFLSRGYPSIMQGELYPLSSAEEYFAHAGSQRFKAKVGSMEPNFWQRVKQFIRDFVNAIKRAFKMKRSREDVLDQILKGDFEDSAQVGAKADRAKQASLPTPEGQIPNPVLPKELSVPSLAEQQADADVIRELDADITTQVMGRKDTVLGRPGFGPQEQAAGAAHAAAVFAKAGLQVEMAPDGFWRLADQFTQQEVEGHRLLSAVTEELSKYAGPDSGYLGNLINSLRIHMAVDANEAFSRGLKDGFYSIIQGEASHRGSMLKALDGFAEPVEYMARRVEVHLKGIYDKEFGGPFVRKVAKQIISDFRDYVTGYVKDHPESMEALQNALDAIARMERQQGGGRVFKIVQGELKPKQPKKIARMEQDARVQEAAREILQQAKAQGIEPVDRPGKPMTPLQKLIHMVNPKTQEKIQGLIEKAVGDAERNAGIKSALAHAGSPAERDDLEGRFNAGEEPTPEQVEAGLATPEFAHWKEIRDNLLGYDPVTIKLVEQLLRSDFRGTKFSPPAEKVVDVRLDLEKLAKEPDIEVARVIGAYLDNLGNSMDIGQASPETKQRIQEMVEKKVSEQVEVARARVREPAFAPPKVKGAALTPEQRIGQLINAKLFADPRLNVPEMVARVAAKSAVRRLTPRVTDLVNQALQTPFYRQGDIAENFANLLIEHLGIGPEQADKAKEVFVKAMEEPMMKAKASAQKKAAATVTPRDRSLMDPRKPLWKKLIENANAGNFDGGDILRQIAQAHGWLWSEAMIAKMHDLAGKVQRLNELTPSETAQAGGDPKALVDALVEKQAVNRERSMDLRRQMATLWSRLTKPLTYRTAEGRDNIARAVREFVCAKMLYKVSHPFRMLIEIVSQGNMHTPTRAAAAAWDRWSNDKSAGRDANLLTELLTAAKDAYAVRLKTARATWTAFKQGMAGSPEARNVDRLMSSISAFERMAQVADEKAAAGGQHGQRLVFWLMRHVELSYRIMQALDNVQGVPAEYQELRQRVVSELRLNGATRAEAFAKADGVMGDFKAEWALAYARAAEIFDLNGREKTKAELDAAARDLVWARTLQRIRAIGLPADDFAQQAENVRAAVSWTLKAAGPGGALAKGMEAANQALGRAGIPIPLFPFSNAIATGINRTLTWSGGGFFPGMFKDDPFFASDEDRRQRKVEAAIGSGAQMILFMAILAGLAVWTGSGPKDPRERELWHKQGHRENTLEIPHADGTFHAISGILGWLMPLRPAMAMAGAIVDLQKVRAKEQQKINDEALKLGLQPGKIRPIDAADWFGVALSAVMTSLIGGRTAVGMTGSVTQEGQFNAAKAISSVLTRAVPLPLEGYQELTRMAGIQMDAKLAGVVDFMLPTGASGARKLNVLGDPVGTDDSLQRVVQIITLGTYPFAIDPKKAAESVPYAALFNSGYRPPEISPSEGYAIGSEYRPMTNDELSRYARIRGELLKQELAGIGSNADRKEAAAAFQSANQAALERLGVDTGAKREAAAATTLPATPASRFVPPGAPTAARISGGGTSRISGLRSLRGARRVGLSRMPGIRGPSLRRGVGIPQRRLSASTGSPRVRSLRPRRG